MRVVILWALVGIACTGPVLPEPHAAPKEVVLNHRTTKPAPLIEPVAPQPAVSEPVQAPPEVGADPCEHAAAVCRAAGYHDGGEGTGKSLRFDCMEPVLGGARVQGVQVDPVIAACASIVAMQRDYVDGTGHSPCDAVVGACKQAGYYSGGYKQHKGLWWSCVAPLVGGDRVDAVTLEPDVITACANESPIQKNKLTPFVSQAEVAPRIAGIPSQPDVVTVIPFYEKPDETALEKTKVVITAEVDGLRGNFVLDLGTPTLRLNHTFLQRSASGGVEEVTDTNRAPEGHHDTAHVTMRLGTLYVDAEDLHVDGPRSRNDNAVLDHMWGNYSWVFAPRLGNISLSVLEPLETIIDYVHRRVILIRLDKQGHRMAKVPAYAPRWTAPLLDIPLRNTPLRWWGIAVRPDNVLDTHDAANNTTAKLMDTGAPIDAEDMLGYPFLRKLGVFGLNHRTHQFILYN